MLNLKQDTTEHIQETETDIENKSVVAKGERIESLEFADANQYVQNGETTRSYYIAQGTNVQSPVINHKRKEYFNMCVYKYIY